MEQKQYPTEILTSCPLCRWSSDEPVFLPLYETVYWRVVLAPNQRLLGRCIVYSKRHFGDVAETTPQELFEWLDVVKVMEKTLSRVFNATMFNWSCYMNLAYRQNPPQPHVHWWVVPRYNHPVRIDGWIFEDNEFGSPYDHGNVIEVPSDIHHKIAERIKQTISEINLSI